MTVREVLGLLVLVAFLVAYGGGSWLGLRVTRGIRLSARPGAGASSERAMGAFTWLLRIFVALVVAQVLSLLVWPLAFLVDRLP